MAYQVRSFKRLQHYLSFWMSEIHGSTYITDSKLFAKIYLKQLKKAGFKYNDYIERPSLSQRAAAENKYFKVI